MKIEFENQSERYRCDLGSGVSLTQPVQFSGSVKNPWGVPVSSKSFVKTNGFVGSTLNGGACNVDQLSLIPHCHGTHTETVGHIVDADCFVSNLSIPALIPAVVISPMPVDAGSTSDTYTPAFETDDHVVSSESLKKQLEQWANFKPQALIVRTKSSDAFFSSEAMTAIVETGIQHLLVDLPSVDRLNDGGILSNHRIFWNVEPDCQKTSKESRVSNTITELVRVPDQVTDGPCLLSIQVSAIESDAAPSRPVVYSITKI